MGKLVVVVTRVRNQDPACTRVGFEGGQMPLYMRVPKLALSQELARQCVTALMKLMQSKADA